MGNCFCLAEGNTLETEYCSSKPQQQRPGAGNHFCSPAVVWIPRRHPHPPPHETPPWGWAAPGPVWDSPAAGTDSSLQAEVTGHRKNPPAVGGWAGGPGWLVQTGFFILSNHYIFVYLVLTLGRIW